MPRDDIHWCNRSLENHFSLGCKCNRLLFPLHLDSPRFLLVYLVLGMDFLLNPPRFGLPMSIPFVVLAIVHAWVAQNSKLPTVASIMTPFLATKKTKHSVPYIFQFVMMLVNLVAWSPNSWRGSGWQNHHFFSLFQVSTSIFEWNSTRSFSSHLFLYKNGFFHDSSCVNEGDLS